MCTVVFIPGKHQNYFASLRDENTERPVAIPPALYTTGNSQFLAPKDGQSGGTWLGMNKMGNVIILLNGGREKHKVKDRYSKSRGLIVSDLLASERPLNDWNLAELNEIEPFTLIIWADGGLFQLVWDGDHKSLIQRNALLSYVWSSSTLYNSEAQINREISFKKWLATKPAISMKSLLLFFLSDTDTENGFIINRGEKIKTLSYSFINHQETGNGVVRYYDFLQNKLSTGKIIFTVKANEPTLTGAV